MAKTLGQMADEIEQIHLPYFAAQYQPMMTDAVAAMRDAEARIEKLEKAQASTDAALAKFGHS